MIQAKIVAGSKNPFNDKKLVTFQLRYPRIIHAEVMTHAMLVKNSSSSRAIPFSKKVEAVSNDPFIPIAWQKDHKGMQGTEYIDAPIDKAYIHDMWLKARNYAIEMSTKLNTFGGRHGGVTKQLCNRLLEPFEYIDVVISGTEWEHFFFFFCPKYTIKDSVNGTTVYRSKKDCIKWFDDIEEAYTTGLNWLAINESQAEIHIQALAELMWDLYQSYDYKMLEPGDYHLPFIEIEEDLEILK